MASRTVRLAGSGVLVMEGLAALRVHRGVPFSVILTRALKLYRLYLDTRTNGSRLEIVEPNGKRTKLELMWDD